MNHYDNDKLVLTDGWGDRVYLHQTRMGNTVSVWMTVVEGVTDNVIELTPEKAVQLAEALTEAAKVKVSDG